MTVPELYFWKHRPQTWPLCGFNAASLSNQKKMLPKGHGSLN
jgi:hypothetical protein